MELDVQAVSGTRAQSVSGKSPEGIEAMMAASLLYREVLEDESELLILDLDSEPSDADDEERTDPRGEAACHFDMTRAEWQLVRSAPMLSFLMIAAADGQVLPRERQALVKALEDGKRSTCEVFRTVCSELFLKRETLMAELVSCSMGMEQIPEVYQLLNQRLGREEAERFKWCLLELARRVGEASGGLFASWGWLRREERHALAELAVALESDLH
jgi:hypothetical protein